MFGKQYMRIQTSNKIFIVYLLGNAGNNRPLWQLFRKLWGLCDVSRECGLHITKQTRHFCCAIKSVGGFEKLSTNVDLPIIIHKKL